MSNFSERLSSEIEYIGLSQKDFAEKAGIKRTTLSSYLGAQQSMPPADIAVKLASALGVTVEYLVTGKNGKQSKEWSKTVDDEKQTILHLTHQLSKEKRKFAINFLEWLKAQSL